VPPALPLEAEVHALHERVGRDDDLLTGLRAQHRRVVADADRDVLRRAAGRSRDPRDQPELADVAELHGRAV
jgi:hypothetical protein